MLFFYLLELLVLLVFVHQVVLPVVQGRPVFPFFREKKIHDELTEVKQQLHEQELVEEVEAVKSKLKQKESE